MPKERETDLLIHNLLAASGIAHHAEGSGIKEVDERMEEKMLRMCKTPNEMGHCRIKGNGFLPSQMYEDVGRNDDVAVLTFRPESSMYKKYSSTLTVRIIYTQEERKSLEVDPTVYDEMYNVKAESLLPEDRKYRIELSNDGIDTRDIVNITRGISTPNNNTYTSKEPRTIDTLYIQLKSQKNGNDIYWMYGILSEFIKKDIALTTEEYEKYLAYKYLVDREHLSESEVSKIFNHNMGLNPDIEYHILYWKLLIKGENSKEEDSRLDSMLKKRVNNRIKVLEKNLIKIGLSLRSFMEKYPKIFNLIIEKTIRFHDIRYNTVGKYLLYLSYESFLHIYFRHVREADLGKYLDKDKFQLREEDVLEVVGHVMRDLNDEYQKFKERQPSGRFYRTGKMAYYLNGDYYYIVVNTDGSISTFYKATRIKNRHSSC